MANTLLTISKITNEALMVLENELTFAGHVNREYDDQYAVVGAKIGAVVNVRRPARFLGTTGPALNVEDMNETYVPVVVGSSGINGAGLPYTGAQFHVDTQFTTQDLALSLDMFSDRVLKPAVAAIANKIDRDGLLMAKNTTANIVGVPGSPPTGLITYLTAGAYLDAEATPRDGNRAVVVEPFTSATIVDSLKGLFVPERTVGEQYTKGLMGRDSAGMTWLLDQNILTHTFGNSTGATTLTVNGAGQGLSTGWAGTSTISINNSAAVNVTLQQGDTIQLAGVYAVNPQHRGVYGSNRLRNFVVTQAVTQTGAGNFNVTVAPALIYGGQFQNVSASPAAAAAVTNTSLATSAATAVASPQNLLFHRDAFTLAVVDLELPEGVHFAGRASDKEVGLSIRVVRQYNINNDSLPCRLDVLYGWAALYPEMACRIAA